MAFDKEKNQEDQAKAKKDGGNRVCRERQNIVGKKSCLQKQKKFLRLNNTKCAEL